MLNSRVTTKHIHGNTLSVKSGRTAVNGAFQPRAVNFGDNLLLTAEQTGIVPSEGIRATVQTVFYPCLTTSPEWIYRN